MSNHAENRSPWVLPDDRPLSNVIPQRVDVCVVGAGIAVVAGVVLLLIIAATSAVLFGLLKHPLPPSPIQSESQIPGQLALACVYAPLLEETLYRLCLLPPAVAWLGARGGIVVGGVVFAGLHVLYGNPSPENLLGGFILSWAYLKSGTLVVPIALHSLGNLCAMLSQVGYFYLVR
jgi:uncharacterized protein